MKICLVIPPSSFLLDDRVFPSLGILRVCAVLRQEYPTTVLDLSGIKSYEEVIVNKASEADIFGITATTPQLPAAVSIARLIRWINPKARVILGGPHLTLTNAARKKNSPRAIESFRLLQEEFHTQVAGDGEEAIWQALDHNGLVDADIPSQNTFLTNERYNELPFPARDAIDLQSYHYEIDGVRAMSLIAQLGCPFRCGFCGGRSSPSLRRIRMRSADRIVEEMLKMYYTYRWRGFMFYDDELNVNKEVVELMRLIRLTQEQHQTEWRLRGFIKAELLTEEQAEAMANAGFRWILVGFESGSPRILKNINKVATQEENTRCLQIARKYGLKVKFLMSLGHPGESQETIEETRQWLTAMQPDDLDVTIVAVYPGTNYYDDASLLNDEWVYTINGDRLYGQEIDCRFVANYYKGDPNGGYISYIRTDFLSAPELVASRNQLEKEFKGGR